MDLNRAKTALIIAFLILNAYLGYQLWYHSEIYLPYLSVTSEEVEEVVSQLEQNNYQLGMSLSRQAQAMSLLSVHALELDEGAFVQALFPDGEPLRTAGEEGTRYAYEGAHLLFPGKGRVLYRVSPLPPLQAGEELDLQRLGEEYLQEKGIFPSDVRFGGIFPGEEEEKTVTFFQIHEGFSLYTSYINLHFSGDHVTGFDLFLLEPLELSSESRYVLPATQALLRFLEIKGPAPLRQEITGMNLGYFSEDYDAQKWDVVPVWRISGGGWAVYLNAFSGEEEKN